MMYSVRKAVNLNGQNQLLDPFDIDYYHRTVSLIGEINDDTAAALNAALRALARDSGDDITLYIQSPGGSVSAGLSIYDTMSAISCDVCTVACGMAASMGAFLLAAGARGKRWVQPHGEVLIHQPLGGAAGQATDMKIHVEHLLKMRSRLNQILAEQTGQPLARIEADTERDTILSAEEALLYGLVDQIGDPISHF